MTQKVNDALFNLKLKTLERAANAYQCVLQEKEDRERAEAANRWYARLWKTTVRFKEHTQSSEVYLWTLYHLQGTSEYVAQTFGGIEKELSYYLPGNPILRRYDHLDLVSPAAGLSGIWKLYNGTANKATDTAGFNYTKGATIQVSGIGGGVIGEEKLKIEGLMIYVKNNYDVKSWLTRTFKKSRLKVPHNRDTPNTVPQNFAVKEAAKTLTILARQGVRLMAQLRYPGILEIREPIAESRNLIVAVTEPYQYSLPLILVSCTNPLPHGQECSENRLSKLKMPTKSFGYRTIKISCLDFIPNKYLCDLEMKYGFYKVGQTLGFLHKRASVTHGKLRPECIVITPNGEWKLMGLELSHTIQNRHREENYPVSNGFDEFKPVHDDLIKNLFEGSLSQSQKDMGEIMYIAPENLYKRLLLSSSNNTPNNVGVDNSALLQFISDRTVVRNSSCDIDHNTAAELSKSYSTPESDMYALGIILAKFANFAGSKFSENALPEKESLHRLVRGLIAFHPHDRINAEAYLAHPYFTSDKLLLYLLNIETTLFDMMEGIAVKCVFLEALCTDMPLFPPTVIVRRIVPRLAAICYACLKTFSKDSRDIPIWTASFKCYLSATTLIFATTAATLCQNMVRDQLTEAIDLLYQTLELQTVANYSLFNQRDLISLTDLTLNKTWSEKKDQNLLLKDKPYYDANEQARPERTKAPPHTLLTSYIIHMIGVEKKLTSSLPTIQSVVLKFPWIRAITRWAKFFTYNAKCQHLIPAILNVVHACVEELHVSSKSYYDGCSGDSSANRGADNVIIANKIELTNTVIDVIGFMVVEKSLDDYRLIQTQVMPVLTLIPSLVPKLHPRSWPAVRAGNGNTAVLHLQEYEALTVASLKSINLLKYILAQGHGSCWLANYVRRSEAIRDFGISFLPSLVKSGFMASKSIQYPGRIRGYPSTCGSPNTDEGYNHLVAQIYLFRTLQRNYLTKYWAEIRLLLNASIDVMMLSSSALESELLALPNASTSSLMNSPSTTEIKNTNNAVETDSLPPSIRSSQLGTKKHINYYGLVDNQSRNVKSQQSLLNKRQNLNDQIQVAQYDNQNFLINHNNTSTLPSRMEENQIRNFKNINTMAESNAGNGNNALENMCTKQIEIFMDNVATNTKSKSDDSLRN